MQGPGRRVPIVDTVGGGQFGQIGQVSGPSLGEMLSQRGFEMPKMKTGIEAAIMTMYKDPITGKMKSGGPNAASHAKAMSDFYGQNPEALNIAKQHQQDQQYNPGGGRDLFNASLLRPPQEIMPQPILSTGRPMSGTGQPTPLDPSSIRLSRGDGGTVPPGYYQEPPRRPSMENPSGSLGGQIRPNPYSAPPQIGGGFGGQTGGGIGGLQQFMQIMQMIMQMVQQSQGMGIGGMGMGMGMGGMGGMRRNNFAQPQGFGGFNQYQSRQQYRPQFQQNFGSPYGPY